MADNSLETGYKRGVEAARERRTLVPPHISPFPCVPEVVVVCAPRILGGGHTGQVLQAAGKSRKHRIWDLILGFRV